MMNLVKPVVVRVKHLVHSRVEADLSQEAFSLIAVTIKSIEICDRFLSHGYASGP